MYGRADISLSKKKPWRQVALKISDVIASEITSVESVKSAFPVGKTKQSHW